ncbi:MAG: hypothetical protein ACT4O2_08845 [Beijerinckiaceae bacterium]
MKPWQGFLIISSSSALAHALFPAPSNAQAMRSICAAAEKHMYSDSRLSEAVKVVFGSPEYSSQKDECIYPLQVLHYRDADVLLAIGNEPGQACHGCSASLSAYVMRRKASGLQLVKRFIDFGEAGTFGNPGLISPWKLLATMDLWSRAGALFKGTHRRR